MMNFPPGFVWGVATSSYQIEGSPDADGKGKSIWDTYAHTPGKIADGSTGDVANDHYRLYRQDVALMKSLGARAYRFSISWPRVFPSGRGQPNEKGLDFYSRLVDELLAAGIEPYPTLYHWDLPQALQDEWGGWQSRQTSEAFADYAGYVAAKLGDRVKNYFTLNEFLSFVDMGHFGQELDVGGKMIRSESAPGLKLTASGLSQVRHHAILAHGLGVQAIRANAGPGTRCGPAENIITAVPLIESQEHVQAAERATRELNAPYLTAILEGRYTDSYLSRLGADAPRFTEQDMKAIGTPVDFVGLNVYRPFHYVLASDQPPGWLEVPLNPSHPKMHAPWMVFGPECMYWATRFTTSLWGNKDIYITENGCAADDTIAQDGRIYDTDRVMYLRNYLTQLWRASADGLPVKGYFQWSLMDNFEWTAGYSQRFGIVHVDFSTQKRTPKLSAEYFREVARANCVM
jgi:beta-glucosidase